MQAGRDNNIGDNYITINLKEAADYKILQAQLGNLNNQFEKVKANIEKYSDDETFREDLIQVDEERQGVRQNMEILKKEVLDLAAELSEISIYTERLHLAKLHFEAGKFDEARAILDAEAMSEELDALLEKKKSLTNSISENNAKLNDKANEFLIKAYLTSIEFTLPNRFEKTQEYFEKSLSAARNGRNLSAFGRFLINHNQIEDAEQSFIEALDYFRRLADTDPQTILPIIAEGLTDLGHLYFRMGKDIKAKNSYNEAIELYDNLPEAYKAERVRVLNDKAKVLARMGDHKAAKDVFGEIFNAYMDLPPIFLKSDLANTFNNFGNLLRLMNKPNEAEDALNNAVELRRDLAASEEIHLPSLATALCNLALAKAKYKPAEAEKDYVEAIEIIRRVANNNPYAYLSMQANIAANMSLFYLQNKPNAGKSIPLAMEAIHCITPFIGKLQTANEVMRIATNVLKRNGLDGIMFERV